MAVGLFGGTFNPVHFGHLITSQRVREIRNLEKIILMPCNISPFKVDGIDLVDGYTRIKMLELAVWGDGGYEISDLEVRKGGVSYTYDTVMELKKKHDAVELIIGYDQLKEFDKWYRADDIVKEAKLVVLRRKTDDGERWNRFFEEAIFTVSPTVEISSTEIRERIRSGLPVDFLLPGTVAEFIKKEKLYL